MDRSDIAACAAGFALLAGLAACSPAAASSVQTIYKFDAARDGAFPHAVVASPDGRLFGELAEGPNHADSSVVFELDPPVRGGTQWTEKTIFTLPHRTYLSGDRSLMLLGPNGHLFFTASDMHAPATARPSMVWELSPQAEGGSAWAGVVRNADPRIGGVPLQDLSLQYVDSSNALYGFAYLTPTQTFDNPVVARLAPLSTNPSVYWPSKIATVCAPDEDAGVTGCYLFYTLLPAADGSLYGSSYGGLFSLTPPAGAVGGWTRQQLTNYGQGYVAATIDRSLKVYAFGGGGTGNIATFSAPSWKATALVTFNAFAKLRASASALVQDRTGLLFGTLSAADDISNGVGAVFRTSPQAPSVPTVLHKFSGPDGEFPFGLTTMTHSDGSRVFVGLTSYGGLGYTQAGTGAGTVFQVTP